MLKENQIAKVVVDSAFQIHKELGPGLLETVYEKVLAHELEQRGLFVEIQKAFMIQYKNMVSVYSFVGCCPRSANLPLMYHQRLAPKGRKFLAGGVSPRKTILLLLKALKGRKNSWKIL